MNKVSYFTTSLLAVMILCGPSIAGAEDQPEATQELRNAAAKAKLEAEPSSVSLYAKGLCCPSCAIGVRKQVSKLDFVDKGRFTKGVELDAKVQLVTVALKEGEAPDLAALAKAVDDAGYDPVHLYRLNGGALKTSPLVVPKN